MQRSINVTQLPPCPGKIVPALFENRHPGSAAQYVLLPRLSSFSHAHLRSALQRPSPRRRTGIDSAGASVRGPDGFPGKVLLAGAYCISIVLLFHFDFKAKWKKISMKCPGSRTSSAGDHYIPSMKHPPPPFSLNLGPPTPPPNRMKRLTADLAVGIIELCSTPES